jgi:maleylpyruvate isomerase
MTTSADPGDADPSAVDPAAVTDPAAAAAALASRVAASTGTLLQTAAGITDQQARGSSLLPGWSRGHVLSHLARNADSIANLLIWARTRVETPQYASLEAREEGVSAGAGWPAAELAADIAATAAELQAEVTRLAPRDWGFPVRGLRGGEHPAWYSLWRRLAELEIHHADLDAGYGPDDWPADFAAQGLARVAADFAREGCPSVLLCSPGGRTYQLGQAGAPVTAEISGSSSRLLAWLTGRGTGAGLTSRPAGPLPDLPSW